MSVDTLTPELVELSVTISADALVDKLRELGATVIWFNAKQPQDTIVELEVSVDASDAAEALPSWYFEEDEPWSPPEARDVADFISACGVGDRALAAALLPRLNLPDATVDAGERALRGVGGRA